MDPWKRIPDIPFPSPFPSSRHRAPVPERSLKFPPLRKFSKGELDLIRARMALACSEGAQGAAEREE